MVSARAVSHTGIPVNQPRFIMDIFEAIAKKDLNAVKELIKANPQVVNEISPVFLGNHGPGNYPEGVRPLMWATFVLRATPGPDALIIGELLLGMAAVNKDPKALNASLNEIDVFAGRTALHWAAYNDNTPFLHIIQKFAETHNATLNYNQRDNGGKTPSQVALSKGFRNFAKVMAPARLKNAGTGPVHMAIVGMGATGTALFIRLIRGMVEAPAVYPKEILNQIHFSLIDSKSVLGRGMPYSDELNSTTSILNVHAAGMSIDSTDGADFLNYIKDKYLQGELEQGLGEAGVHGLTPVGPPNPTGYYPRTFFGEYCTKRLEHWIEVATKNGIKVDLYPLSVVSKVGKLDKGVMSIDLKGSEFNLQKKSAPTANFNVTHVFNSTGHWDHKLQAPKPHETIDGHIKYPANRATLTAKGVFKQPTHVAVMGSALSAIDAAFAVLLHPDVGYLTWEGSQPTYHSRVTSGKTPWRVTCYSRRGAWPKVRPSDNRDVDAKWTSPAMYEILRQVFNKGQSLDLKTCVQLLDNEMAELYGRPLPGVGAQPGEKKPLPSVLKLFDPLALLPEGVPRNPWKLVEADVRDCDDGDSGSNAERPWVRWYQIIHGLFPVMTRVYRGLNPTDRAVFDKDLNTPFLWAFAPMPLHSARVLLAMHKAGVLDMLRTPDNELPKLAADKKHVEYPYFTAETGEKKYNVHEFLAVTTGLGSDVRLDASELTQDEINSGKVTIQDQDAPDPKDENTLFLADDDSYEFLDIHGNHSPARRGVGFFTHASYFMIQAVPAVVGHTRNAAELYLAEFVTRLLKDPTKAIPEQKPFVIVSDKSKI